MLEVGALAGIVLLALPYASGTESGLVFVSLAAFVAAWAAQAIHAERRARRRLAPYLPPGAPPAGAAAELLWLAPVVVAGATAFWALAGPAASPDDVLADYVGRWRAGQATEAAALFAAPPDPGSLRAAWDRQAPRLANAAIAAAAQAGPDGGIDPARPWESVRWEDADTVATALGEPPAGAPDNGSDAGVGRSVVAGVVVRQQSDRDTFLGLVPTRVVRLVPVTGIGTVTLRTVALPGPLDGAPPIVVWRIAAIDLLEERIGG
ncbi:MAG TPA: hypothetical protein VFS32_03565 [Candidatus Limnocylindrales bacterium]|nr:hypothetical protein [Candidatus Limnocylindrales bacterium]